MIPAREIREKARLHGVPESTIERDYAQNWLLWALSGMEMAFKGGTCIKKLYIENYRFSDDLDFTLMRDTDRNGILYMVSDSVVRARNESGISFLEEVKVDSNYNGFEVSVYFKMLWRGGSPMKIKLDITAPAGEEILLPLTEKKIMHPYSDGLNGAILAYSLEEIFSEKVRSLFERTRPRDLYDVRMLKERVRMASVEEILPAKFSNKGIEGNPSALMSKKEYFKNAWEASLTHQIKELPDFEDVFKDVLTFLNEMNMGP